MMSYPHRTLSPLCFAPLICACAGAQIHLADREDAQSYVAHQRLAQCEGTTFELRLRQDRADGTAVDIALRGAATGGKVIFDGDTSLLDPAQPITVELRSVAGGPPCELFPASEVFSGGPLVLERVGERAYGVDLDKFMRRSLCQAYGVSICDTPPVQDDGDAALTGCRVGGAQVIYGTSVHPPLFFPVRMTSPEPGAAQSPENQLSGPNVGRVPGSVPAAFKVSTAFEYHSDLDGVHGCTSRQFVKRLDALIHSASSAVGQVDGDGIGASVPFAPDTDSSYRGSTQTGSRTVQNATIYEGKLGVIHWLDAPGSEVVLDPTFQGLLQVNITLLRSVTWDAGGTHGWECFTLHTAATDMTTGRAPGAAAVRNVLNAALPRGGAAAPAELAAAAATLKLPAAQGGFLGSANPEFRNLGCRQF